MCVSSTVKHEVLTNKLTTTIQKSMSRWNFHSFHYFSDLLMTKGPVEEIHYLIFEVWCVPFRIPNCSGTIRVSNAVIVFSRALQSEGILVLGCSVYGWKATDQDRRLPTISCSSITTAHALPCMWGSSGHTVAKWCMPPPFCLLLCTQCSDLVLRRLALITGHMDGIIVNQCL